jgi:prevent-host-death family protein
MWSSDDKGLLAELEIELAAVRLGVPVFRPPEHARCDLAFDVGGRIWRVQCKWGGLSPAKDAIVVHTGAIRLTPGGYVRTTYSDREVDLFGVYCGELDRCFLLPVAVSAGKQLQHLRLQPARNNQRACITLADDFTFEGAIAQLGERCHGMAEVVGSSPTSSTSSSRASADSIEIGCHEFRERFGYWMDQAASGQEVVITRHGKSQARLGPVSARRA